MVLKQLAAVAALSSVGTAALAQRAGGSAFQTLGSRIPTEAPGKVEVIEFFHYGCPHCRDFDPLIEHWVK
jgi:thiol:disulfide interchange protein DsbA